MTQCEGRAPIPQNQSSHLQGERRKDKDASPHRRASTHTHHERCMCVLRCALTRTHRAENNILCVIFKYGFKKDYAGDGTANYDFSTWGALEALNTSPYLFIKHTTQKKDFQLLKGVFTKIIKTYTEVFSPYLYRCLPMQTVWGLRG